MTAPAGPARSERTRVVFLLKSAGLGGMERIQATVLRHLDAVRFEAMVLVAGDGPLLNEYRKYARTHVYMGPQANAYQEALRRVPSARLRRVLRAPLREARRRHRRTWAVDLVAEFRPHVVVWHHHFLVDLFAGLEDIEVPKVQQMMMHWSSFVTMRPDELGRMAARDHFVCEGAGSRSYLEYPLGVPPERLSTICIGIDPATQGEQAAAGPRVTRASLGLPDGALVVATAGHIGFDKGPDLWVRAAASLRNTNPHLDARFVWIGGRPSQFESHAGRALRQLVERLGLGDRVQFVGQKDDVLPYVDLCDVYVQPSRDDAFPRATLEAMSTGKPVVSFPVGIGLEKYASDALLRVDEVSPEALATALAGLAEDPARRRRLGMGGRALVEERFDAARTVRRYEDVLWRVARGEGSDA